MELPSLEEEATMSDDPYEYGERDEMKPGDAGCEEDEDSDLPAESSFTIEDDALYERLLGEE